jgi:hypothetical protein
MGAQRRLKWPRIGIPINGLRAIPYAFEQENF